MIALANIEKLVNTSTHTTQSPTSTEFIFNINTEKDRILEDYHHALYSLGDKLAQYVLLQQQKLLGLMETISNHLPHEAFSTTGEESGLIYLYKTLHELLCYLEKNCPAYLDLHCKVPLIYLITARDILNNEIPSLHEILTRSGIDDFLQEIILAPFEELIASDDISYKRLHYIKTLFENLQKLPADSTSEHVEEVLLYMNYNNKVYIKYQTTLLKKIISSFPTAHQQLMHTKYLLKVNSQQLEHPHLQYTHIHPSLKQQLKSWLTEESIYLEQIHLYPDTKPLPEELARWADFKLKTDLSVNEIGCLLRAMMESGLITNKNVTEVADFAATFISTNNQSSISSDSLRQKLYKFPNSSAESVKEVVMKIYNAIKQLGKQ